MTSDTGDAEWVGISDDEDMSSIHATELDAKVLSALPPCARIRVTSAEQGPPPAFHFTARFPDSTTRSYRLEVAKGERATYMMNERFKQRLILSQIQPKSSRPILGTFSSDPETHFLLQELLNEKHAASGLPREVPKQIDSSRIEAARKHETAGTGNDTLKAGGEDLGILKSVQEKVNSKVTTPIMQPKLGGPVTVQSLLSGGTSPERLQVLEETVRKGTATTAHDNGAPCDIEDSPVANSEVLHIKKEKAAANERPVTLSDLLSGATNPEMMQVKKYEARGGVVHLEHIRIGTAEFKDNNGQIHSCPVYYDTLADRNFATYGLAKTVDLEVFRIAKEDVETCKTLLNKGVEVQLDRLLNLPLRCREGNTEEFQEEHVYLVDSDERVIVLGWSYILRKDIVLNLASQIAMHTNPHDLHRNENSFTIQTSYPQLNSFKIHHSKRGQAKRKKHDEQSRSNHLAVEDRIENYYAGGNTTSQTSGLSNSATHAHSSYPEAATYAIEYAATSPPVYTTTPSAISTEATVSSQDSEWTRVTADTTYTIPTWPEHGQQYQQMKGDGQGEDSPNLPQSGGYSAYPDNNTPTPQDQ